MSFVDELRRRNVVKVALLYVVASWLVLQVVDVLSSLLPVPAWTGSLVFVLLVAGFLPVLIFSWVYELTPEGLKREKDVDRSRSVTGETGRRINILIVVLLVFAVALLVAERMLPESTIPAPATAVGDQAEVLAAGSGGPAGREPATAPDRSVAVLPFANRSARDEDAYFVDGIHDDIITQLARIGSLTVISRTSVERFRNPTQSMKEIGAILGVEAILEGGVQRAGDRVRINAQLVGVESDTHLWAETYDRELTSSNIFAIQSEISAAIAQALEATLTPDVKGQIESARTTDIGALDAYFLGRQAMAKRTVASLAKAEEHLKTAIALDADYALAYVALANTYFLQTDYTGLRTSDYQRLARPLVEKALAIDGRLGEAYIARAVLGDLDPPGIEANFRKGIGFAPGYARGRQWYGGYLLDNGRVEEALVQLEKAVRLDPMSAILWINLGGANQALGRFEEARESYEAALRVDPGSALAHDRLGMMAFSTGRLDDAVIGMRNALALDPTRAQSRMFLAVIWDLLGDRAASDEVLAGLPPYDPSGFFRAFGKALLLANRGERIAAGPPALAFLEMRPTDRTMLGIAGVSDLQAGRAEAAVARYERAVPSFTDQENPNVSRGNFMEAVDFAFVLHSSGEAERADRLLDQVLEIIETMPRLGMEGYWLSDARIYAMRGERGRALAALRSAVGEGWLVNPMFRQEFTPLYGDPEYQMLASKIDGRLAEQLARVRELERTGVLPPLSD